MGKILKDETAARLMRLLNGSGDQPIPQRRGGATSRIPVLVRCTSDTAVGGGDVGDQCYAAVVLDINGLLDEQEETANVWLTLLDAGSTASPIEVAVPTEGKAYVGLYSGSFDPDPEGTPDPRPRVFAAQVGAESSLAFDGDELASDATISTSNAQIDTGLFLTLPTAGTFLVFGTVRAVAKMSAFGGSNLNQIAAYYRRGTGSGGDVLSYATLVNIPVTNQEVAGSASLMALVTTTGSEPVTLWAIRNEGGGSTWTTSYIDGGSNSETSMRYVRIA